MYKRVCVCAILLCCTTVSTTSREGWYLLACLFSLAWNAVYIICRCTQANRGCTLAIVLHIIYTTLPSRRLVIFNVPVACSIYEKHLAKKFFSHSLRVENETLWAITLIIDYVRRLIPFIFRVYCIDSGECSMRALAIFDCFEALSLSIASWW